MIPEKKYTGRRAGNIAVMAVCSAILLIVWKFIFGTELAGLIVNIFVSILFFMIFVFTLVYCRTHGLIHSNMSETYNELAVAFAVSALVIFGLSLLPAYFSGILLVVALFLALVSNVQIGIMAGCFLDIIFCLNVRQSFFELICLFSLTLLGAVLMQAYSEAVHRSYASVIIFCICIILPCIFDWVESGTVDFSVLICGIVSGAISDLLLLLLFDRIYHITITREEACAKRIIGADYPLVQELQRFSAADYRHAIKVSGLCRRCAEVAEVDADIAAAAGFYYRLGRLVGEPIIDNGVQLAQLNCFPQPVINILYEYNGEKALPGSPESAIVNMVDALVLRFEHLKEETQSSNWNREILIYQTMNDKSGSGLYDKSGLSINQYLKIREFLVRGDDL